MVEKFDVTQQHYEFAEVALDTAVQIVSEEFDVSHLVSVTIMLQCMVAKMRRLPRPAVLLAAEYFHRCAEIVALPQDKTDGHQAAFEAMARAGNTLIDTADDF